uniref:Solute carrier family 15 member 2 n=1 Tax=Amphiprion ocellaris TaxID=80972 RepID=A0AAQ5XVH0_AMPOC
WWYPNINFEIRIYTHTHTPHPGWTLSRDRYSPREFARRVAPSDITNQAEYSHAKDCGILRANTPLIQTGFVVTYFVIFTWVRSSFDLFCMCVMTALLTLYFVTYLHWDKDLSTAIYHAFGGLCYFTPILGALIADSWLGKFKTIIYLSIVYVIGHVVKSVGAIPTVGGRDVHIALSMLGLILIAFGTGGIKPCVAAFGGDQFEDEHVRERQKFFSIFYMSINAGIYLQEPFLTQTVHFFTTSDSNVTLHSSFAVVFIAGSGMYKKNPLQGNILLEVCNCVGFALRNRWYRSKHEPRRSHWLDWAEEKYSKRLIQEIKMVLRVLVLYIPLPMFWALFDQQGSRWTCWLLSPTPCVCRPLRKMATGMIFAALAFGAATLVEISVVKTVVDPAPAKNSLLQVVNLAGGDASVKVLGTDLFPEPIPYFHDSPTYETFPLEGPAKYAYITVTSLGADTECNQRFEEEEAYSLILFPGPAGTQCKLVSVAEHQCSVFSDAIAWFRLYRFLNTLPEDLNITVGTVLFNVSSEYSVSPNQTVSQGVYSDVTCCLKSGECYRLDLGLLDFGAIYTIILKEESGKIVAHKTEDVKANNVHIAWQIPQYALITAGEVMFSITGLEFSYSQAPANMKSVLQAGWLLTVAFGNVIVLIVAEGAGLEQWKEFLLFASLLLGVCIIFSIMTCFYTYVNPEQLEKFYLENSGKEGDNNENMKKKNNDVPLKKTGKGTRL